MVEHSDELFSHTRITLARNGSNLCFDWNKHFYNFSFVFSCNVCICLAPSDLQRQILFDVLELRDTKVKCLNKEQ